MMPCCSHFVWALIKRGGTALLMLAGLVGTFLAAGVPTAAHAQPTAGDAFDVLDRMPRERAISLREICGIEPLSVDVGTQVPRPREATSAKQVEPTANITVQYSSGFPTEARFAFERAVEIWERHIASSVQIRIQARFEELGPGALAAAGPRTIYAVDTNNDGAADRVFGDALADARSGADQSPGEIDIIARFNSRQEWHYGEDQAPANRFDFTSVALHEIGHGLNYFSLMQVQNEQGGYGADFDQNGRLDDDEKIPSVYGAFLARRSATGLNRRMTDFQNPSAELADALRSEQVRYVGGRSREAAGGSTGPVPPRIYAPSEWQSGSSISHLDETTYPPGDINSLMSPRFNEAETVRQPGPVMCGQFRDIGWELGPGCQRYFRGVYALEGSTVDEPSGTVQLRWTVARDADIDRYFVDRKAFDGSFQQVAAQDGAEGPSITLDRQGLGQYTYRLRWRTADGEMGQSVEEPTLTLNVQNLQAEVADTDERGRGRVQVQWDVPEGTSGFDYVVERRRGPEGAFQSVSTTSDQQAEYQRQQPGAYTYRIRAEDAQGNAIVSDNQEVDVPLQGNLYLAGPYPNPVRSRSTLDVTAEDAGTITVQVYNSAGQRVRTQQRAVPANTPASFQMDGQDLASGVYFIRVRGNGFVRTRQMVVVR